MHICCLCRLQAVEVKLNFGQQPISHRFLNAPNTEEFKYEFCLGYCKACGLVQLVNPIPADKLSLRFPWIVYQEPEAHLDQLVEILQALPGITPQSTACGVSGNDTSLLQRLQMLKNDLHPQVIIARNILEHAHNPLQFMQLLRDKVSADGYVVFEVPDYSKNFIRRDYSTLWEEHITYFSPYTFLNCLQQGGFLVRHLKTYAYDTQDYLVAVVSPAEQDLAAVSSVDALVLHQEKQRIEHFLAGYGRQRKWFKQTLSQYRARGKIALLGAGHLGCHFINFMQLQEDIDFVVDDDPHKRGLFMPGSQLPIVDSSGLEANDIALCLLSLSPQGEQKVLVDKKQFVERGGKFASIFSSSQHALLNFI